jgi:hypothetical protein
MSSKKNPKRVAAGRANRKLRGPLTPNGRRRLREAALANRPWLTSTGPKTPAGKRQAAANGKARQIGRLSVREAKAQVAVIRALFGLMRESGEFADP